MNKNRIFIIAASAAAILGSFLPWATASAGALGSMDGQWYPRRWLVNYFPCNWSHCSFLFKNYEKPMEKPFAIGVIVIGAIQTIISIIDVININKYAVNFGGFGISLGFGLILCLLAAIATVATGLLAMSGGKITKETFEELASTSKEFAQSVGRVTSSTVQTAVKEIKKETEHHQETAEPALTPEQPAQPEQVDKLLKQSKWNKQPNLVKNKSRSVSTFTTCTSLYRR